MDKFEKYIEPVVKVIAIFVSLAYASGFLVWNIYLQGLGFDPNLLQGKFVLTGVLCCFFALIFLLIINFFKKVFKKLSSKPDKNSPVLKEDSGLGVNVSKVFYLIAGIGSYLFIFSYFIFPQIDASFGGGRPKLVSIIGDEQQISYLNNFGIGSSSSVQTGVVCSAYDDKDNMIIVLPDRIISIKKELYKGFVTLRHKDEGVYIFECLVTIESNLLKNRVLNTQSSN